MKNVKANNVLSSVLAITTVIGQTPINVNATTYKTYSNSLPETVTVSNEDSTMNDNNFTDYSVDVTVNFTEDGSVSNVTTDLNTIADRSNRVYFGDALNSINTQLSDGVALDKIDVVSEATCSSMAIKRAIASAITNRETNAVSISTDDLDQTIQSVSSLTESDYTKDSWENLQKALDSAKAASENHESQDAVDTANQTLSNAIAVLVKENKSAMDELTAYIEKVEKLDSTTYTDKTWNTLSEKLEEAKKVVTDDGNSQACQDALSALQKAYKA